MSEKTCAVPPAFSAHHVVSGEAYQALYQQALADPDGFWVSQARRLLTWYQPPTKGFSGSLRDGNIRWFEDGTLNASFNCLDRHVAAGHGDEVAIIWEPNDPKDAPRRLTYLQLLDRVERAANVLKALGVGKGDRVCIYLQMIPELAIAMLACARIGAIHSVVFGAFSASALRDRINDCGAKVLITQDAGWRGNKSVTMKQSADAACAETPSIEHVLVVKHTGADVPMQPERDLSWEGLLAAASATCPPEPMDAEQPLFILYTSGSTGKPKGVVHTTGGYLTYAAYTHELVFDYRPGEVFWCTADCGWITGHSYVVYGPLANRATVLMYEGVPSYPDFGRFWQIVAKHRVNIFYTAPTALRALRAKGDAFVIGHDRSTLRILGTVGEPIKAPEWEWYRAVVGEGRCPIVDTWWQTETGGILISPLPGATPTKPGSATFPLPGVRAVVLDEAGNELGDPKATGLLAIAASWPGMLRDIWGDRARFLQTYLQPFPGYYLTGDGCRRDPDGYYWITGRVDDIMIVSGHNIGTAEVEGAIGAHPAVAEAAVVGIADDITGQAICAFVILKAGHEGSPGLADEINQLVRKIIGPHANLKQIRFTPALPKTRSGKIMRRLLRDVAEGRELGDVTTLEDPAAVAALIEAVRV
ncbi:acetate--CoA ligase [Candidatus Uhrbacteria bacterium]|nr:acetate--CoA ligase [Candidatus Uhrbacteria bacterium]